MSLSRRTFTSISATQPDARPRTPTSSDKRSSPRTRILRSGVREPTSSVLDQLSNAPGSARDVWQDEASENLDGDTTELLPHRLHINATKHNTHITFVQPPRTAARTISSSVSSTSASAAQKAKVVDVLLSLSTGNIGFRKGGRGSYDAAYQLGAFVMKQIQEKGMLRDIKKLEVVLRGFGAGREAVTKILLGTEGRFLRDRISAVMDATRLKFGGNRSPNPRRL